MIQEELQEKLAQNIYGLSFKKAQGISEYILFSALAILRGRNKNPVIDNAGSMSVSYFQKTFNVNRTLCANILDHCFDRGEDYRTGACKPATLKPWLREMTLQYISENHYRSDEYVITAGQAINCYPTNGKFYVEFNLPLDNLRAAIKEAKMLINAEEFNDQGHLKNNSDEYQLAKVYLEAGLQREGYFCEKYEYKPCGRMYQTGYGFQNMKKVIRNLAFKGYYNIDINSSFFRMAWDLYSDQWNDHLKEQIKYLLDHKEDFYSQIKDIKNFKINLLATLLGSKDLNIINHSPLIRDLYRSLNEWMPPGKRRKQLADSLFKREQQYVKDLILQLQEMPHVLIHDGFIVKNNYQLDEKIWSIKKL